MDVFQPLVRSRIPLGVALALTLGASQAFPQANGRLQLHFMNVGQADRAPDFTGRPSITTTTTSAAPTPCWPSIACAGRPFDRGGTYSTQTYGRYVQRVGGLRRAATAGMTIRLDSARANPVVVPARVVKGVTFLGDTAGHQQF